MNDSDDNSNKSNDYKSNGDHNIFFIYHFTTMVIIVIKMIIVMVTLIRPKTILNYPQRRFVSWWCTY